MAAAPPRPIEGTVGSRIRLIFDESGSEWLLLLNEDDGDSKWQAHYWSGIPDTLAKQLNNCSSKGRYAKEVAFGQSGAWYVNGIKRDGSGGHSWWGGMSDAASDKLNDYTSEPEQLKVSFGYNSCTGEEPYVFLSGRNGYSASGVDSGLSSRMQRINKRNSAINFVRIFADEGYFISDDEGTEWCGVGEHFSNALKEKQGGAIEEVGAAGDGSWVVVRANAFVSSTGVSSELTGHISDFFKRQRDRNQRRKNEIREHNKRVQREAREAAQREVQAEQERVAQAVLEIQVRAAAAEVERAAREARDAEECRRVEEAAASNRVFAASLRAAEIIEEVQGIQEEEERLSNRKRALQDSILTLPPAHRTRVERSVRPIVADVQAKASAKPECVVCQDRVAERAIVPCGHHCLCDECAHQLVSVGNGKCPLCRGNVQSTLKIFSQG